MYVSMPLHKATINVAVIDENSIVPKEVKIRSKPDNLREFSYSIPSGSDIVIKSSST
jgi:ADP-glucose pyrophosphorylase